MDFIKNHVTLLGTLGAGVALGFAGVYVNSKLRRIDELQAEVSQLRRAVTSLKRDFEVLKIGTENGAIARHLIEERFAINEVDKANSDVDSTKNVSHIAIAGSETTLSTIDDNEEEFYDFAESSETNESFVNAVHSENLKPNVQNGSGRTEDKFKKWLFEVDEMLMDLTNDKQKLYDKICAGKQEFGPKPEILWRLAKACHLLAIAADSAGDQARKKELTFLTVEHAKAALLADEQNFECHKWYAVAIGSVGDYLSSKERIEGGYLFKEHVDKALKLKPDDPTLHHMLGRWCYEVSKLSWVEKKVASTLFAKVPETSNEDALSSLLKAYELKPIWKENILFISNCYIALGKYYDAMDWVQKGLELEIKGEDDNLAHEKLGTLGKKYSSYKR